VSENDARAEGNNDDIGGGTVQERKYLTSSSSSPASRPQIVSGIRFRDGPCYLLTFRENSPLISVQFP